MTASIIATDSASIRRNIATFAKGLPSLATVASGYEYREAVCIFWRDCQKAVHAIMPTPRVCGGGNGEWIDYGRALTPEGILAEGASARRMWMDYARAVALASGAAPTLAGVENALAQKCGPAALAA